MNRSIAEKDPDTIVRMGICLVPEGRRVFADLSVIENLVDWSSYTQGPKRG